MNTMAKALGLACLLMVGSAFADDNMIRSTTVQQKKADADAKIAAAKAKKAEKTESKANGEKIKKGEHDEKVKHEEKEMHHKRHHHLHHHPHHFEHERVIDPHAYRRIMGNH